MKLSKFEFAGGVANWCRLAQQKQSSPQCYLSVQKQY